MKAAYGSTGRVGYIVQYYKPDKMILERIYAPLGPQLILALHTRDRGCCAKPTPRDPGKQNTWNMFSTWGCSAGLRDSYRAGTWSRFAMSR